LKAFAADKAAARIANERREAFVLPAEASRYTTTPD
jgi:hypothetical protein